MNTTLKQTTPCPNCGRPLPAGAPAGLCPACLLAQGAETDAGGSGGGRARFEPPPLDQITELFPQLEVLRLLGAGGMGAVYLARQPALDRMVALKVLPANGPGGAIFEERFNREARALARLSHPNIVAVHEFGRVGGLHFFLMEFVDGANLRQLEQAGRLSPREALQIIPQICDALQYAHDEGVVHRDIKPENVLVDRKGRVKIADFGLAKILGTDPASARLTVEGQVMGTPHYMAPEQVERPLAVDHRADIYSLGVVFYEMLTGDLPLGKFAPPSRKVQVDVRLDEIVLRALENDPARRYQQASEVKQRVTTVAETPAPANPLPASPGDANDEAPKPGVRFLRWLGIPVVVERDGEREVNFHGALTAVFVTMLVAALAHQIVRWVAGTEHALARFVWLAAGLTVAWGIRRTLNQPWDDEPRRAANGTVLLAPERRRFPYLADALMLVGLFALIIGGHYFKTLVLARPAGGMKAALARQTAARDPQTGILTVKLPGRGSVELLAVADVNAAPNQWWRPDGTPETNATYELPSPVESSVSGRVSKDFLVRISDLPSGADHLGFSSDLAPGVSSGGQVFRDGRLLSGVIQARTAFPPDAKRDNLRVALALEPWRTIGTQQGHSQSSNQERRLTDPNWQVIFHAPTRNERGEAQISYVFGPEDRLWTHRLIAVGTNGVEHTANSSQGTPFEKVTLWTCTFDRLPWAQVREYRLQVRPLHWIEFPNVALQPAAPLPTPQSSLVFTMPTLLTVDEVLDLDVGHTTGFPSNTSVENPIAGAAENMAWALEQGFDASVGVNEWDLLSVTLVPVSPAEWESLTPQEAEARLMAHGTKPRTLQLEVEATPAAYAFRTRDGGLGLLQIVEVSENGQKFVVQLRHAVQPGNTPSGRPAKLDPESHTLVARLPGRGSIELLALTDADATPGQWWRPDGRPVAGVDYQLARPRSAPVSEGVSRHLILRWQGLPDGSTGPFIRGTPDVAWVTVGEAALANGQVLKNTRLVGIAWPRMPATPALRVGFAMDPWRTICTYNLRTHGTMPSPRRPADPPWTVVVHQAVNSQAGVQATMLLSDHPHAWRTRVVAVDTSGAEHPSTTTTSTRSTSGTKDTALWSHEFPGVTLADLKELQVRVCPIHWAEFTGINLEVRP